MRNFEILFDDAEPSPIEHAGYAPYGHLGFPGAHAERPWTYANFVQSIDGIASFKGKHASGADISQSAEDRWLMDLLRAHADAVITGINTLIEETRTFSTLNSGRGPVYRVEDPALRDLRTQLGRKRERNIFVTATAKIDLDAYRVFDGDLVDAYILTTTEGAARLAESKSAARANLIVAGEGRLVDLPRAVRLLKQRYGVEHLLCEGGPTLYGFMAKAALIDEKFVTVAPLEIGLIVPPLQPPAEAEKPAPPDQRPTTFMAPGFTKDDAPQWRWMSCRRAGDHQFSRYRRR
jgi:5-amino-6-(5-phosphoribosylamino)uracil reductase